MTTLRWRGEEAIAELRQAVKLQSATADTSRILADELMHTHAPENYDEALEAVAKARGNPA